MTREHYQARLAALQSDINAMAETTLSRYETALEVLESGDAGAASRVIEGDADINDRYLDLEGDCVELIALQQPVAGDLRFIASSFKILTDLERIGDLATNLARYGRENGGGFDSFDIRPIGRAAGEMVADAMDAYERGDSEAARAVAGRDNDLDARCRGASESVVRELLSMSAAESIDRNPRTNGSGEAAVEAALTNTSRALLTIRDIERVGDHAVNICARTVYMVENDDDLIY